jgi:prevent-host-death family protein
MQAVGVRDLKARLSYYLRVAKTGEIVLVTEHGRVVAALGPPDMAGSSEELQGLQALVARGIAVAGARKRSGAYAPTGLRSPAGAAQAVVDELRADRG